MYFRGPKRAEPNKSGSVRRVKLSSVALPHFAHRSASIGMDSPQFLQRRAMRLSFICPHDYSVPWSTLASQRTKLAP